MNIHLQAYYPKKLNNSLLLAYEIKNLGVTFDAVTIQLFSVSLAIISMTATEYVKF